MEKCFIKKIDSELISDSKELWCPQIIKKTVTIAPGDGSSYQAYSVGYLPAGNYNILFVGSTPINATLKAGNNTLLSLAAELNKKTGFTLSSEYQKDLINITAPNIGGTYTVYIFDTNNFKYELISKVKLASAYYNGTCVWYNPFNMPSEIQNNGEIFMTWYDTNGLLKDYILNFMKKVAGNPSIGMTETGIYCSLGVVDVSQVIVQGSNPSGTNGDTEIVFEFYHKIE